MTNELSSLSTAAVFCVLFMVFLLCIGSIFDIITISCITKTPPDYKGVRKRIITRPWSWSDIGIFAIILSLTMIASGVLCRKLFGLEGLASPQSILIQTTALPLVILIIIFELMARRGWTLQQAFGIQPKSFINDLRTAGKGYIAIIPIFAVISFACTYLLQSINYPVVHQDVLLWVVDQNNPLWFRWYLVFMAVFIAPVTEEILFRGIALPVVMRKCRTSLAIIFISLFFAAAHIHLPVIVPLMVLAGGLSLAYIHSGSLMVPILMHSLFNGVMLVMVFCSR